MIIGKHTVEGLEIHGHLGSTPTHWLTTKFHVTIDDIKISGSICIKHTEPNKTFPASRPQYRLVVSTKGFSKHPEYELMRGAILAMFNSYFEASQCSGCYYAFRNL